MVKILAIDDNQDNLVVISALLKNLISGCTVITARSGAEGIEKAKAESPDTILLDIKMPKMDGFEVCKRLKSSDKTKHIPVVILTGMMTDTETRIKGLEIGADAFIAKPVDKAELVAQVNVALRIKKTEDRLRDAHKELKKWIKRRAAELLEANRILKREIEDRKRTEEALRLSEKRHRDVVENANEGIVVVQDGMHRFFNSKSLEITGCSEAEYMARPFGDIFHPDDREGVLKRHFRMLRGEVIPNNYSVRIVDKSGNIKWMEVNSVLIKWEARPAILNFLADISDQKRAEKHIQTLMQELIKAQETTRQKIARYLHDQVAQDLSTVKIVCETLFDNHPGKCEDLRQKISKMSDVLQGSIHAVRNLAYDLRPPSLDQLGLTRTLFQYCEDFSETNGVTVDFYSAGLDEVRLDFDTEINLYRMIQEALNNIKKHAAAEYVTVRLIASFPKIILRLEDDGKGFDRKEQLITALNEKRMGLRSMEERATLLNGSFRIQSRPMEGTKILVEVPYKEEKSDPEEKYTDC
jgi:PAS domain S-box-containing protein